MYYSILDICTEILGTEKVTADELICSLTPKAYNQLKYELRKKYPQQSALKKLIRRYEIFLNP